MKVSETKASMELRTVRQIWADKRHDHSLDSSTLTIPSFGQAEIPGGGSISSCLSSLLSRARHAEFMVVNFEKPAKV